MFDLGANARFVAVSELIGLAQRAVLVSAFVGEVLCIGSKLAQFLESDIKRAFDAAKPQSDIANLPPDIEQAAIDINAQIRREMGVPAPAGAPAAAEPEKPLAGPILSLTARPLSPGGALITRQTAEGGPLERVLAQGSPIEAKSGRADNFAWPRL